MMNSPPLGLFLAALLLAGCASSGGPDRSQEPDRRSTASGAEPASRPLTETDAALRDAIRQAIAAARPRLRLVTECMREGRLTALEVFGNGVAIWDNRRQFELGPGEVSALLAALDRADFAAMPGVFGGRKPPAPPPRDPESGESGFATEVTCRVALWLDGHHKQVAQLRKGEQSRTLAGLAAEIFSRCEGPAEDGIEAASLADGLKKIAAGELAPETIRIFVQTKPDLRDAQPGDEGFLARVLGRTVTAKLYRHGSGYAAARRLELEPAEVVDLARTLAEYGPDDLPENLWSVAYTDLTLQVLHHKKSFQARQFARMTPTTHGEHQLDFDLIQDTLHQLHARVLNEGEPTTEETSGEG